MRAWLRWRREVRRIQRERDAAYLRWMRARYEYQDLAVVLGFPDALPAEDRSFLAMEEFKKIRDDLDRLVKCGPGEVLR